jgi:hypothetical protein
MAPSLSKVFIVAYQHKIQSCPTNAKKHALSSHPPHPKTRLPPRSKRNPHRCCQTQDLRPPKHLSLPVNTRSQAAQPMQKNMHRHLIRHMQKWGCRPQSKHNHYRHCQIRHHPNTIPSPSKVFVIACQHEIPSQSTHVKKHALPSHPPYPKTRLPPAKQRQFSPPLPNTRPQPAKTFAVAYQHKIPSQSTHAKKTCIVIASATSKNDAATRKANAIITAPAKHETTAHQVFVVAYQHEIPS